MSHAGKHTFGRAVVRRRHPLRIAAVVAAPLALALAFAPITGSMPGADDHGQSVEVLDGLQGFPCQMSRDLGVINCSGATTLGAAPPDVAQARLVSTSALPMTRAFVTGCLRAGRGAVVPFPCCFTVAKLRVRVASTVAGAVLRASDGNTAHFAAPTVGARALAAATLAMAAATLALDGVVLRNTLHKLDAAS